MSTPSDRFPTGSLTGSFCTRPTTGSPVPSPTGTGTGGSGSFWNRNRWNQSTTKSTTQPMTITDQEAPMTTPNTCPECIQGKHDNCDGTAFDLDQDVVTVCVCAREWHGKPVVTTTATAAPTDVPAAARAGGALDRRSIYDVIAQACGDPGSVVKRGEGESLSRWSARAAMVSAFPLTQAVEVERDEARAEVERLQAEVKHWKDHAEEAGGGFARVCLDFNRSNARAREQRERAEAAESELTVLRAKVARVEALVSALDPHHLETTRVFCADIRATLADPAPVEQRDDEAGA